jgi:D-mannonate dehydratase
MKLGLGLYRALLTPENLRFARQAGCTHIVAHLPGHFTRGGSKIITSDNADAGFGISEADDPIWTYEGLRDLKALVESEGLVLEALENFAPAHWYDVLLDGPRRAEQMAHLKQIVRDLGRLGIPTMGYCFTVAGTWGRALGGLPQSTPAAHPRRDGLEYDLRCGSLQRRAPGGRSAAQSARAQPSHDNCDRTGQTRQKTQADGCVSKESRPPGED